MKKSSQINFKKLSPREKEVVDLLIKGLKTNQIANVLSIKSNTVSTFKKKIYFKTGTQTVLELFQLFS